MRVLAVNDISCIGKCSLSVTLPIVSACGVTCDVLPTSILSTHTGGFEGYTFQDLTVNMSAVLDHWKTLGVHFDVLYSGYLGSHEQIRIVERIKNEFLADGGIVVVDPVMGDGGKLYDRFDDAFVAHMRDLCRIADFILPNLTEGAFLTGTTFDEAKNDAKSVLLKLQTLSRCPVLTGVEEGDEICVYYLKDGMPTSYRLPCSHGFFCGAGDVFASAFVGCLARKVPFEKAIALSANFTTSAIKKSATEVEDKRYGINFEKELYGFLQSLNT